MSHDSIQHAQDDLYLLDTPLFRRFVEGARESIAEARDVEAALDALQPRFAALLADPNWLPDEYMSPYEGSGMGGGIASWLLFRAGDRSLSLISLVVPPGAETPVHDHLAWGLVGLYRGEQSEIVYARQDELGGHSHESSNATDAHGGAETVERAILTVAEVNDLKPGEFYRLIPPHGDIHSVRTTSAEPSVSIHLLTNDVGCVVRHAFDPTQSTVRSFRSGYSNLACEEEQAGQT
jgi:predicted metal-dependent enzyme (double-stranded beta helix superfamily)